MELFKKHVGIFCLLVGLMCVAGIARAQIANTVTVTASPNTGVGSVTPTITWSTSPAGSTGCIASGAWTGNKAASGSQAQPAVTANATYTLVCSWPGAIQTATINFVPPTTNTDNSPLTNLAGYRLLYGTSATNLNQSKSVADPAATSMSIQPAAAGTYSAAVRAVNAAGAESDNSNLTTFTAAAATTTATGSASVTVTTKPNPPTNVTATVALALDISLDSGDGFKRTVAYSITGNGPGVFVGMVKVGTPALDGSIAFDYRGAHYCRFLLKHPRTGVSNVSWDKGVTPTQDVAAPCA